jgi:phage gpG-like protein
LKNLKKNNLAIKDKIKTLPKDISILAKSHFEGNFTRQGFDNEKWQEVKRRLGKGKGRDATRAILSGRTKRLAKSLYVKKATLSQIIIASSSKYGAIHNYGGTIDKKARKGVIYTNKKNKWTKKKKAYNIKDVNIGAHKIVIPKRKFLGYSQVLNKKILNLLNKIMK